MLHTALLLAPCASVNPPRTWSDTGTKERLMMLFLSAFNNLLFTTNRIRKVLVNAPIHHELFPSIPSRVNFPMPNIPVLKLNYISHFLFPKPSVPSSLEFHFSVKPGINWTIGLEITTCIPVPAFRDLMTAKVSFPLGKWMEISHWCPLAF